MAAVGAILGRSFSGFLMKRNVSQNASRKLTLLMCGLLMPLVILAAFTKSPWIAVAVIGMAAALHQTWTTTGVAILADLFPPRAVASVVGIASFTGSLMGVAAAEITGRILDASPGNYAPMFIYAGGAYLLGAAIVHFLVPRLEPVQDLWASLLII